MKFQPYILFFFITHVIHCQQINLKTLFSNPMTIPIDLSANFGEIRANHYHFGIDVRSEGREGLPILAAADGYVSRIKIDENGYGKAIYLDHPTGYTTLYGHLSALNPILAEYVKEQQYEKKSYTVDLYIEPKTFNFHKGDTIASSGNSGGSRGAHLHFEIRDRKTQNALNVQLFGLGIVDTQKPVIRSLVIYPMDSGSVNKGCSPVTYKTKVTNNGYTLDKIDTIQVSGRVAFGLQAYDFISSARTFSGIYYIRLFADGQLIYNHQLDEIAFNDVRYINSMIDYQKLSKGQKIYRLYRQPGNLIDKVYKNLVQDGILFFDDNKAHKIECEVSDPANHVSRLVFYVVSKPGVPLCYHKTSGIPISWNIDNTIDKGTIKIKIPKNSVYENFDLNLDTLSSRPGLLCPVYRVHNSSIPIHSNISISIKTPEMPETLRAKVCIVVVGSRGELSSSNGDWENGYITARVRNFGDYSLAIDSVPPTIRPINILNRSNMSKQHFIMFTIGDNLSGIKSYNGYIDGQWVLFEYDAKYRRLVYYFDSKRLRFKQDHVMELKVVDYRGNERVFKASFFK